MLAQLDGDEISVNINRAKYETNKENCMARVKILLVTTFVLSLFLMCGGCESERHERREERGDEWREQQSQHDSQLREEHHEEQHEERH
jgi:hypothetical protein